VDSNTSVWPTALPVPMVGARVNIVTSNNRTMFETGRVRNRRNFQDPIKYVDVVWNFTEDQFSTFKSYFETELENGTLSFIIELFGTDTEVFFFDCSYSFSRSDNLFSVQAFLQYTVLTQTVTLSVTLEQIA